MTLHYALSCSDIGRSGNEHEPRASTLEMIIDEPFFTLRKYEDTGQKINVAKHVRADCKGKKFGQAKRNQKLLNKAGTLGVISSLGFSLPYHISF